MDQTTLKDKYAPNKAVEGAKTKVDVETYISNTKADIQHGFDKCYYVPSKDFIAMVDTGTYKDTLVMIVMRLKSWLLK